MYNPIIALLFIITVAVANLALGYAAAVKLGYGPKQGEKDTGGL